MDNLLLMQKSEELETFSKELGFTNSFFNEDFVLIKEENKKQLLKKIKDAKRKKKKVVYHPHSEEMLRFVLERTAIDMIIGTENIHPKDSTHYLRGGLDQVLCKIAAKNKKVIGFSFNKILNFRDKSRLLARMIFNIKLCKKYKVRTFFSNFSVSKEEVRSAKDLSSLWRILGGKKESFFLQKL